MRTTLQRSVSTTVKSSRVSASKPPKQVKNVEDQSKNLKRAQEILNKRTRRVVFGASEDDGDGSSSSLSESQGSEAESYYTKNKRRKLRERKEGQAADIAALEKLQSIEIPASRASTPISNRFDTPPTRRDEPRPATHQKGRSKRNHKKNKKNTSSLESNQAVDERCPPTNTYKHEQLFGVESGMQMQSIGNGVLCNVDNIRTGQRARNARDCSRQLLSGVFKLDAVLNCSLNGRKKLPQNVESQSITRQRFLDGRAIHAIVAYSQKRGKERNWPEMTDVEIRRGISKKLWQIGANFKKAMRNDSPFYYGGIRY
ncbi:hypothetical protein QAD02_000695 [Eretmocerus hayati]|uniref:Uncharacterized protein n=1 Tax=Eretmocerus hayati TaxID=131215 RepID=A0ACC2NEX6_9HYME|nr:hypothetical protein QAD02_000695 [Eretmocerus hayati]